jgi:hypothetical protein
MMPRDSEIGMDAILARIDAIAETLDDVAQPVATELASELLTLGEAILERWVEARGMSPTADMIEGFRLLALHRQGSRGEPSFNACRESCRELAYHFNLVRLEPAHPQAAGRLRLAAMVARHIALFVGGKLEVSGLGEFCCSSRPLRQQEAPATIADQV